MITIVFYYGLNGWDASKELYEMLDVNDYLKESEVFRKFIPNYKINLIDAGHMEHLENLQTDLQLVLGMVQYRSNTEKLKEYVKEHEEYFRSVDKDTYNAIVELLHSKSKLEKVLKSVDIKKRKEQVNVCKAIDGIYENGYKKGKEEMQDKVKEAEMKAQKAEEEKRKAEEEKHKVEEEKRKILEDAAVRMLATMEVQEVARLLGLELEIVNQLSESAHN